MRQSSLSLALLSSLPLYLLGCGDSTGPNTGPDTQVPTTLAVGGHHICRLVGEAAFCWGRADAGQVGADSTPVISAPVQVAGNLQFASIVAGGLHSCALTQEGQAWCWGQNDVGQTGLPIAMNQVCGNPIHGWQCIPSPQPLATDLRFTGLVAGSGNTCGFGTDGTTYCWGSNAGGQLGGEPLELCSGTPCSVTPVALPAEPKLDILALGSGGHFCGLTADSDAYCWGSNSNGQLGTGQVGGNLSVPSPVVGATRFKAIAVGGQHTCALALDGAPWCWGGDILPPGTGGVSLSATPVAIESSPKFVQLITGAWAACGRTPAGTVFCWGINAYGEMGITPSGLTTRYSTPQPMATQLRWTSIAGSLGTFCGLTGSAQTWCWGFGDYGELGSLHQASAEPVQIEGF